MVSQCKHLRLLDLAGCKQITDDWFLAWPETSTLTSIAIGGATSVTEAGVRELARACPHMHHLSLAGCSRLTRQGITATLPLFGMFINVLTIEVPARRFALIARLLHLFTLPLFSHPKVHLLSLNVSDTQCADAALSVMAAASPELESLLASQTEATTAVGVRQ